MTDRPVRVTRAPQVTHARRPMRDMLGRMPAKVLVSFEGNAALPPCCRKVADHQVELSKTHAEAEAPDRAVFECACGRRHIRLATGGGRFS